MPTEQCNFRCKYCYESYQKGEMTEENQKTLLKFLQRKISSTSKIQISWFGGEPIEAIHVVQRIMEYANRMCDKQNVQLISDMTTNAYNLDDVNFDMLYNLRVFSYQVTLDGLEEQHNKQRVLKNGNGTFEKIVNNLLYIKNNYQKYKLANVSIRVNMSRDILNHFSEFIDFYRKNFGNDRRFTLGLTPISDMGGTVVNEIKDRFIDVSEIYTAINNINLYDDNSIQFSNIMRAFSPKESLCYASKKNTYVIGSDLSLYKCTVHFEMNENKIGRIAPNGEEIVDELIHRRWYVNYHFKEKCKSCFLLPTCYGGGCPHKRVFAEENLKKCVLSTWKNEIGNAIKYVLKRNDIETIKFN